MGFSTPNTVQLSSYFRMARVVYIARYTSPELIDFHAFVKSLTKIPSQAHTVYLRTVFATLSLWTSKTHLSQWSSPS